MLDKKLVKVDTTKLIRETARRTGYSTTQVEEVVLSYLKFARIILSLGRTIILSRLLTLRPSQGNVSKTIISMVRSSQKKNEPMDVVYLDRVKQTFPEYYAQAIKTLELKYKLTIREGSVYEYQS